MDVFKIPQHFSVKNRKIRLILYTLFSLIVADALITTFLVINGQALEVNPFLRVWVGQELFVTIKVSGAFLAVLLLWIQYNKNPRIVYIISAVFLVLYTSIIYWNLSVFITTHL
ncbi:DUF5658 family protein [Chloroflexota bacterium]